VHFFQIYNAESVVSFSVSSAAGVWT